MATNIRPGVPGVNYPDVTVTRQPVSKEPLSTTYRHKMREALGFAPVNKRKRPRNHCNTCGRSKTKETGHSCLNLHVCFLSGERRGADDSSVAGYCLEQEEAMRYLICGATFSRMHRSTRFVSF